MGPPRRMLACVVREEGAPERLLVTLADMSERWHREQELAEVARFPEMNPAPVLRFDRSGNVVLANVAALKLFGTEDLVGRTG